MFKRRKQDEQTMAELDELTDSAPPAPPHAARLPAADSTLGVPPFRPTSLKEMPMGRSPLVTPGSAPGSMNMPSPPHGARPGQPMAAPARAPMREPEERRIADERRTLVVGRGISLQGTVQDAERLVVEGTVEASMINAVELAIAHGGIFKGEVEVEDAEIAGTIDGTLTARATLVVRSTGKVLGTARCRRLQVEDGGQITGRIEMQGDRPASDLPPLPGRSDAARHDAVRGEPFRSDARQAAELG